jgi:exonuclease III
MAAKNLVLLDWNVHGLNAPVKRSALREMASTVHATVVCIQETKLRQIDNRLIYEMLGPDFIDNFSFLPSFGQSGTRGGILIVVSASHFKLIASRRTCYTLTIVIQMLNDGTEWALIGVYDPHLETDKLIFMEELKSLKQSY